MVKNLLLEVSDLKVKYSGGLTAVSGVSFALRQQKGIVLAGPCGSGKSSILKAIAGLSDYTGSIVFDGKDISDIPVKQRDFVFAAHDSPLPDNKTVRHCLGFGLKIRRIPDDFIEERTQEMVRHFGLCDILDKKIKKLVDTDKRLVIAARAFMRNAALYILDDISFGVSGSGAEHIRKAIWDIIKERELTYILAEEDFDNISRCADDIIILNRGSIMQRGGAADIRSDPCNLFCDMYTNYPNAFKFENDFSDGIFLGGEKYLPEHCMHEDVNKKEAVKDISGGQSMHVGISNAYTVVRQESNIDAFADFAGEGVKPEQASRSDGDHIVSSEVPISSQDDDDGENYTKSGNKYELYVAAFRPGDCRLADSGIEARVVSVCRIVSENEDSFRLLVRLLIHADDSAALVYSDLPAHEGDTVFIKISRLNLYNAEGMRLFGAALSGSSMV